MPNWNARALVSAEAISPDTEGISASGLFADALVSRYLWQETYTARRYVQLLSTYSDHIALPRVARSGLFDCITALIDNRYGGRIRKQYLTELIVARKL